ncbi:DUF899 domain-containing protein [Herbaspirillum robiniae]|uniref:Thioredoxin n=1 Tax=Herbaspirillum robiniae TaxID=2014887 RepID=A0A246WLG2_9BURK|nr:thioredoxin family protein [Herbaspirillum robiniae]OWY27103.1 thioredoxin [Herbaspirillum robiniae]
MDIAHHPVVSTDQWLQARGRLLEREKEIMRLQDRLAAERRALPWRAVDKDYRFDTPEGLRNLPELFAGRRQLLVQHFMFGPGWEEGCPSCSYMADHSDGMNPHLAQRDITLVAVSRAPLAEIARFRRRMGWRFDWVSSHGSDFNADFGVSFDAREQAAGEVDYNYARRPFPHAEAPGISVFVQGEDGRIYHSYSTYGRGVEVMMGAYRLMDLTPGGRGERDVPHKMEWVRHHDRYERHERSATPAGVATESSCCRGRG